MTDPSVRESRRAYAVRQACGILLSCDVRELPPDPLKIGEALGYRFMTYSELASQSGVTPAAFRETAPADAFTHAGVIVYDDAVRSADRIRFTLLHEIGHNVLGHCAPSASAEAGEAELRAMESEANAFARTMLLPVPVLDCLRGDPRDSRYARLFCMSAEAWKVRLETACRDRALLPEEDANRIVLQFRGFMFGRRCARCGHTFTDGSRKNVCPVCGCTRLLWAPESGEKAADPPSMTASEDLKPVMGQTYKDPAGYWDKMTDEQQAERRVRPDPIPWEDRFWDETLKEHLLRSEGGAKKNSGRKKAWPGKKAGKK